MSDVSETSIACTLDLAGRTGRADEIRRLMERALIARERTADGLVLRFRDGADTEAEVRDQIAREKTCCAFLEFTLERRDGELRLEVTAPESARPFVDSLFGPVSGNDASRIPEVAVAIPDAMTAKVVHRERVSAKSGARGSSEPQPLEGKRVLVTRPAGQAEELVEALRARGAEPILLPAIEIRPLDDPGELDRALERVAFYDWVIFTSANGVRAVWDRLAALDIEEALEDAEEGRRPGQPRVAAIGPGTAAALERRGVRPAYVPPEYVAEALADGLPDVEGAKILMLRADRARAILRERLEARGARVHDVAAYHTVSEPAGSDALAKAAAGSRREPGRPAEEPLVSALGRIDAVTFTSSSTVHGFLRRVGRVPEGAAVVCIGPITARTARELGLAVDAVAERYTVAGLVEALVRHFQDAGSNELGRDLKEERP
jgi:uroporphyrinogen-III synthase